MDYPLFSIGVPTYKRGGMLRACVLSILEQSFQDFELLLGNDDPSNPLNEGRLGLSDEKIKIYNHRNNIGELANLNFLLAHSRGRYFTWLGDDDAYYATFLESVMLAFQDNPKALVTFTSYSSGPTLPDSLQTNIGTSRVMSGRQFLRNYLSNTIEIQGCFGVFQRNYLVDVGGSKQLGTGFGPYSDVRLAILAGLVDEINFIDEELIFFRRHRGSISFSSQDFEAYQTAQNDLIVESIDTFSDDRLDEDFDLNLKRLLWRFLREYQVVMERSGNLDLRKLCRQLAFLLRYSRCLKGGRAIHKARMILARCFFVKKYLIGKLRINLKKVFARS